MKADRVSLALSAPSLPIVGGGILSALATFLPIAALYFGLDARHSFTLFLALYTASLPSLAASAYTLYKLNVTLARYCNTDISFPRTVFMGALLPLGYVPALQAILLQASQCSGLRGAIRVSPSDLLLNLLTAGAYSATYAAIVSRVVDLALQSVGDEE